MAVISELHPEWKVTGKASDAYGRTALDDECRKVATAQNGNRNDTLNKAAFAVAQLVAGGELEGLEARSRLEGAALACGLPKDEIRATLDSGFQGGSQSPRSAPEGGYQARKDAPAKPVELPEVNAASFAGKTVPERKFHDAKGLIPFQGVTLLYGDGGTGKSLLALQLAAATVTGKQWLGMNTRRGPVYYFSAEDPIDEAHIRLSAINAFLGCDMSDQDALHIAPMVGRECVLGADTGKGIIKPTAVYEAVLKRVKAIKPAIVIIDNAIDVFAGDQNSGPQVKQFMHLLSGLSMEAGCPVLLLAHPSKSGMASGIGDGGSVHWSNSARSRLYLSRVLTEAGEGLPVEDDPCARVLSVKKANYAATGEEIRMRWEDGCFVHSEAERIEPGNELGAAHKAERVFLHLLRLYERQGRHVSATPSSTYAPSQFAKHEQREGVSKRRFEQAMNSLFDQGKIEVQEHGPPSKPRSHIAIVEGK